MFIARLLRGFRRGFERAELNLKNIYGVCSARSNRVKHFEGSLSINITLPAE
jgi:hypothetical protein